LNATLKSLLEAGVHFGHQTRRWNPKMRRYIFTERNGIHIIDLQKTMGCLERAFDTTRTVAARGGKVLFVGTKKQAKEIVREEAERSGMFFVSERWLGGMLTNFQTIRRSIERLDELEQIANDPASVKRFTKKEGIVLERERAKLMKVLEGIRKMKELPALLFVVDTKKEQIAVHEAHKLGIPVIGMVDTNCDPSKVSYPIPSNDDAIRAVRLIAQEIAEAALLGQKTWDENQAAGSSEPAKPGAGEAASPAEPLEAQAVESGPKPN
jgi:small subunit ribosomal protein S2